MQRLAESVEVELEGYDELRVILFDFVESLLSKLSALAEFQGEEVLTAKHLNTVLLAQNIHVDLRAASTPLMNSTNFKKQVREIGEWLKGGGGASRISYSNAYLELRWESKAEKSNYPRGEGFRFTATLLSELQTLTESYLRRLLGASAFLSEKVRGEDLRLALDIGRTLGPYKDWTI